MKKSKNISNNWKLIMLVALAPLLTLFLSGCEKQENFVYIPGNPGGEINMTAWEFIANKDSFSLMAEAVEAAGLQDHFSSSDPKTYIIPTNIAFREYLSDNNYTGISDIPIPILKYVLLYHIVKKSVLSSDTATVKNTPTPYETYNGQKMLISHNNNYQLIINEGTSKSWTIQTSNIEPTNGAIHISPAVVYFSAFIPSASDGDVTLTRDTIIAIQDTYINGGSNSNVNYGTEDLIKVKNVDGEGPYDRRAFLMFDLNEIKAKGNLRDASVEVGVRFTHGKGIKLSLFDVPDTTWSEVSLTWDNAPKEDPAEIAHIISSKVPVFKWDCTDYVLNKLENPGKLSIKIDAEPGSDETDDLYSRRNNDGPKPMLITTFSSGSSNLKMGINKGITVSRGGIAVLNESMLEMTGSARADIIYTLETTPSDGWLINGSKILEVKDQFTQLDIDANNLVYVHNGETTSDDSFSLSVSDPDGGNIGAFTVEVRLQ